jgi:glycine/D-amino acid oxidase-like deaminating enzyme
MPAASGEKSTVIIGAGLVGSSVAWHLARLGVPGVRALDFDLEGSHSSSELNAGGVRGTWTQPINVRLSAASIDYFAQVAKEVGYRPCGYLWLHPVERMAGAIRARERQLQLGWPVEAWDVAEIRRRVPFIDKTDDLAGAIYGPRDGLLNPNLLKAHYRARAREAGATFTDRAWLLSSERGSAGALLRVRVFERAFTAEEKMRQLAGQDPGVPSHDEEWRADRVVNCAGAWAAGCARALGYETPSAAVRRQACIFDCRDVDLTPYGMVIDTTGVYFHPEATNGLAGYAIRDESPGVNWEYEGEEFFQSRIWPALYERSTRFERLRHLTGWAGQYDVSPDESAIIGEAPGGRGRVFEAHSFSGHGVMQSYAAGVALAELMVHGRYGTLDVSELSGERFARGQAVRESWVI